ncbi:MAG: hypothetical protein ACJ790_20335 [Myxococcaceae bacterium]
MSDFVGGFLIPKKDGALEAPILAAIRRYSRRFGLEDRIDGVRFAATADDNLLYIGLLGGAFGGRDTLSFYAQHGKLAGELAQATKSRVFSFAWENQGGNELVGDFDSSGKGDIQQASWEKVGKEIGVKPGSAYADKLWATLPIGKLAKSLKVPRELIETRLPIDVPAYEVDFSEEDAERGGLSKYLENPAAAGQAREEWVAEEDETWTTRWEMAGLSAPAKGEDDEVRRILDEGFAESLRTQIELMASDAAEHPVFRDYDFVINVRIPKPEMAIKVLAQSPRGAAMKTFVERGGLLAWMKITVRPESARVPPPVKKESEEFLMLTPPELRGAPVKRSEIVDRIRESFAKLVGRVYEGKKMAAPVKETARPKAVAEKPAKKVAGAKPQAKKKASTGTKTAAKTKRR